MIATNARSSGNSYTPYNARAYDAWGNVRAGQGSNDPKNRYCGSLGHQQDDESGLIYMRARYYEPGSGRFVNEDPGRQGTNWFSYCGGDPVNRLDSDGKFWWFFLGLVLIGAVMAVAGYLAYSYAAGEPTSWAGVAKWALVGAITGALTAVGGAFWGGALVCAADAYDFMVAAFALRLGAVGASLLGGVCKGASRMGMGRALAGLEGAQLLELGMLMTMDDDD